MLSHSTDGKERILSLSYGKDSMACLGACEILGWPLDRIVTADVWATDDIPADLPPMVAFKEYADTEIDKRYGIKVEHYRSRHTFEEGFYLTRGRTGRKTAHYGDKYGWPMRKGQWCLQQLKLPALKQATQTASKGIEYIGIAVDEPSRFHNLNDRKLSPLVEIGWTEADCRKWCEENGLLSPIYTQAARGGCWFCHNQSIDQLRLLRKQYPALWDMMLKWDKDSVVSFKADGHTVHDFERRFAVEDEGLDTARPYFRWEDLDGPLQYTIFKEG